MASALEVYVNNVQSLSSQGNFAQLCELINRSTDVLVKYPGHLDNVLATLDIQQHSLGVLGILCVKYKRPTIPDWGTLFSQTKELLLSCNGEQVRYATDSFAELCHKFTQKLVEHKQAIRGIRLLIFAIDKIQLHEGQLTSIHSDLCQLCLVSKNMKPALQYLDRDIIDISKEGGQYSSKDFLLYCYYGGMIYTALKNYDRAQFFFEVAVTTPSMAVSHILLKAYKKYILVSLILNGKLPSLPKYTSQIVSRYVKPLCQAYHDLSAAYVSNSPADLRAVVNKYQEEFARNNDTGLVKQCLMSSYKKNIQRLTKTFLTLSLSDMANRVELSGPKEAEKYVLHMIEDGEIYATVNQKDGMVRFYDNPENYNSASMLLELDKEIQKSMRLEEKLAEMDREITVNPHYVQKSYGLHEDDLPGPTIKPQGY